MGNESEKPIHVQVAEALGCKPVRTVCNTSLYSEWECACPGYPPPHGHENRGCQLKGIANYPEDWSATGPLIERYGITLEWLAPGNLLAFQWQAFKYPGVYAHGDNPLVAVCHLILALKAAGKLEPLL